MFCGPLKITVIILFRGEVFYQFSCLVRLFATSWTAARQASLSITNSQSLLKVKSIESVIPSNHLILCRFYKCQLNSVGWKYSWFLLYSFWFSLELLREMLKSPNISVDLAISPFFHHKFYSSGFFLCISALGFYVFSFIHLFTFDCARSSPLHAGLL